MAAAPDLVLSKLIFQPALTASTQATLEYKYYLDSSWTTIATGLTINTDGTFTPKTISGLETDTQYVVRAISDICGIMAEEYFTYPCQIGCPTGYTLSPDGTYCYKVDTVPATPPTGDLDTLEAKTAIQYSTCGSYIYNSGYNVNGTGTSTQITLANSFWYNGVGSCADGTTSDGPMNRCAVWTTVTSNNQDIGFSVCLNLDAEADYYIGIGVDNYGIVKIDGTIIIQQDETAINSQYSVTGACFKVWGIYPIHLTAGIHYLELYGHNISSAAAVGMEIYNNTKAEIIAATSYADLNLIFSTKDEVGLPAYLGTSGYSCPASYSVAACESPVVCTKILTTATTC